MKALVLAGGTGSRLRPLSHSMPKQLAPIANRPLLEHVLENVRELGVREMGVVVGDWADKIAEVVGDGSRFGVDITYLRQDRPLGLAHCVSLARRFLGEEDFVMYLGDNFLPDGVAGIAEEFRRTRPAAQVVARRVPDPRAFGVAEVAPDGAVRRLVEKPPDPPSDLALIGVYFFTPAIHRAVGAIRPSARGELEITDAVQWLVERGATVRLSEHGGFWRDVGRVDDLLECNRYVLGGLRADAADPAGRADGAGRMDEISRLTGPVVLGAGARLVRSRVEGPVVIGAGTLVEDCVIGPYTSIGRGCVLRGSQLADSIVLDEASIVRVRGLRDSLIGRSATVGPADAHHRLVVGDHARVELVA